MREDWEPSESACQSLHVVVFFVVCLSQCVCVCDCFLRVCLQERAVRVSVGECRLMFVYLLLVQHLPEKHMNSDFFLPACIGVYECVCVSLCMCVCAYVCMYVCMYVCINTYIDAG